MGRIRGIDAARCVALLGMVMVHFGPFRPDTATVAGYTYRLSHGRAAVLFVLLAGVGMSLLAGDGSPDRLRRVWLQTAVRFTAFLPVGVALQQLDTPVAVILHYYAFYYLVGAAAVGLRDRALLTAAGVLTVVGPVAWIAARLALPEWADGLADTVGEPHRILADVMVTGIYPLATWTPALLFGVWIGRRDLRAPATRWRLLLGGLGVAACAHGLSEVLRALAGVSPDRFDPTWANLTLAEGHANMPLWIVASAGLATAMLAAWLLLADAAPRLTWPLVAGGQLALSIYVGHLLVLHTWPQWLAERDDVVRAWMLVGRFYAVTLALAVLWRLLARRGPLEQLLHSASLRLADAAGVSVRAGG